MSIIDCMPPRSKAADLVRIVVGKRGQVPMRMQFVLRLDYGSIIPWVRRTKNGICAVAGPDTLTLQSDVELRNENFKTEAEFTISEGQRVCFVLTWLPSHDADGVTSDAEALLAQTEEWWREWSGRCTYKGPYRESVIRSLVTLKALTYAPTGGIVVWFVPVMLAMSGAGPAGEVPTPGGMPAGAMRVLSIGAAACCGAAGACPPPPIA